jgi:radical SAM superfamily enzyme YgiQ (UPF0313 family)
MESMCLLRNVQGFEELRSYEEVKSDISKAHALFPHASTVFIGDSDSLVHKDILKIVALTRKAFPQADRITSYARAHTIAHRSIERLTALRETGLTRLHVGLESGDAEILNYLSKGASPDIMIEGGLKAKEAGFELCFYVLSGAGGESRWKEHADGSAKVINAVNPDFVRLRALSLVKNAPLYNEWKSGQFVQIAPLTRLRETRKLAEQLDVSDCRLASDHVTNYLWGPEGIVFAGIDGMLGQDKELILQTIDEAIDKVEDRDDILDANALVQRGVITNL